MIRLEPTNGAKAHSSADDFGSKIQEFNKGKIPRFVKNQSVFVKIIAIAASLLMLAGYLSRQPRL
jgi:hypothetical protein